MQILSRNDKQEQKPKISGGPLNLFHHLYSLLILIAKHFKPVHRIITKRQSRLYLINRKSFTQTRSINKCTHRIKQTCVLRLHCVEGLRFQADVNVHPLCRGFVPRIFFKFQRKRRAICFHSLTNQKSFVSARLIKEWM